MVGRRFIPAGAGNTHCRSACAQCRSVHPRWRGEHSIQTSPLPDSHGSSPLARGTHLFEAENAGGVRFIPAGAGNTLRRLCRHASLSVHPRWRGEHAIEAQGVVQIHGSSPLARGTPTPSPDRSEKARFIPAGAGNTRHRSSRTFAETVHPRWRGEHVFRTETTE